MPTPSAGIMASFMGCHLKNLGPDEAHPVSFQLVPERRMKKVSVNHFNHTTRRMRTITSTQHTAKHKRGLKESKRNVIAHNIITQNNDRINSQPEHTFAQIRARLQLFY